MCFNSNPWITCHKLLSLIIVIWHICMHIYSGYTSQFLSLWYMKILEIDMYWYSPSFVSLIYHIIIIVLNTCDSIAVTYHSFGFETEGLWRYILITIALLCSCVLKISKTKQYNTNWNYAFDRFANLKIRL